MQLPLRTELQEYASACERLLSNHLERESTPDEQGFVLYYATEIFHTPTVS